MLLGVLNQHQATTARRQPAALKPWQTAAAAPRVSPHSPTASMAAGCSGAGTQLVDPSRAPLEVAGSGMGFGAAAAARAASSSGAGGRGPAGSAAV